MGPNRSMCNVKISPGHKLMTGQPSDLHTQLLHIDDVHPWAQISKPAISLLCHTEMFRA